MNTKTTMKSLLAATAFGAVIPAAFAESSIAIDSVTQRWPWNNKVDITYTVTDGQSREAGVYAGVDFTIAIPGVGTQVVHGYEIGASAETGGEGSKRHTATWTAPAGVKATDCTVTATLFPTNVPSGNDYMVIDLSDGKVIYEGLMATQADSNTRYNTSEEYKRAKLVLRKVPAGIYTTGSSTYPSDNPVRQLTTTNDYYIGIFHVTMQQYANVAGGAPSWPLRPQNSVSWSALRSGNLPRATITPDISGTGFLEILNGRTSTASGVSGFDLPTEVMLEIANRAGTTTKYPWGEDTWDADTAAGYAVFNVGSDEYGVGRRYVGTKMPNGWGLYDFMGNVWTMCRDTGSDNPVTSTDPFYAKGSSASDYMVYRCGGIYNSATLSEPATVQRTSNSAGTDNKFGEAGFRVAYIAK